MIPCTKRTLICTLLVVSVCAAAQSSEGSTQKSKSAPQRATEQKQKKAEGSTDQAPSAEQPPTLENERVRVVRYDLAPGAEIATEEHKTEHLVIPIGEVTVVNASQRIRARSGEVQILKRGSGEKLINSGTAAAVAVSVELKEGLDLSSALCGLEGTRCDSVLGGDLKGGSWAINMLMKTVTLEIARVEMDPNVTTDEFKRLNPTLRVAVSPLKLAEQVDDQEPKMIEQAPGDVTWIPVGEPVSIKNMSATKVQYVMVTFR